MSKSSYHNPDYDGRKEGASPLVFKQCAGKNIYSKSEAHKMKAHIGKTRDKAMRIYLCPECHGFHITKRERNGYE